MSFTPTAFFILIALLAAAPVQAGSVHIRCSQELSPEQVSRGFTGGYHMEISYSGSKAQAGVSFGTKAPTRLGDVLIKEGKDGNFAYSFATVNKRRHEHCGNEYMSTDAVEWAMVKSQQAVEWVTGDSIYFKDVYRLRYNTQNPSESLLRVKHLQASTILAGVVHFPYSSTFDDTVKMNCVREE